MADIGNLFVSIGSRFNAEGIDAAVNKIDELAKKSENITKGFKVVGAALTAFAVGGVAVITNLVNAFAEQEKADIRLAEGLKSVGAYSKETFEDLKNYAGQLQKTTNVGDEQIQFLMQQGLAMGISNDKIKESIKGAIGLSKALDMDLNTALRAVAQAGEGNFMMLMRQIPALRTATTDSERMAIVQRVMAQGFAIAGKELNTLPGQILQLKLRLGDMAEKIGEKLNPTIKAFTDFLKKIMDWFESLSPATLGFIAKALLLTTAIAGILGPLMLLIGFLPQLVVGFTLVMGVISPLSLVIVGITVLVSAFALAWATNWGGIQEKTKMVITYIAEAVKFLWEIITNYWMLIAQTFVVIGKIISEPFKAKEHFEEWKTNVGSAVNNVKEQYTKGMEAIKLKSAELKNAKISDAQIIAKTEIENVNYSNQQQILLKAQTAAKEKSILMEKLAAQKAAEKAVADELKAIWLEANAKQIAMIKDVQSTFTNSFNTMFVDILTTTKGFEKIFIGFLDSIVKAFISAVASMMAKWLAFQLLTGIFGGGFLKMAGIGAFADGVRNFSGGLAMVGERGPEMVALPGGSDVYSAGETNKILQGGSRSLALTVNVSGNNINSELDVNKIAEKVSDVILDKIKNERNI